MVNKCKRGRSLDDSGASVMIEYILIIMIMASFFTIFLLLLNNIIGNANSVVIGQELDVIANDMANRIVSFSGKTGIDQYNSTYWASGVSSNTEEIDLPDMVGGKPYLIQIAYSDSDGTGTVKVTYGDDHSINRTAYFRSGIKVVPSTMASTGSNPRIYYDATQGAIKLVDI